MKHSAKIGFPALTVLPALVCLLTPRLALADYASARAAYDSGNYAVARGEFERLANEGNAAAGTSLGMMYARGRGVAQDDQEAAKWFRMAADQGNAVAQIQLGLLYANGHGVAQDDKEAVKWFRLAADQGEVVAQRNLGMMYANGRGVAQDDKEAANWYRLAADKGDASAQVALGQCYQFGRGVSATRVVAYALFNAAQDADQRQGVAAGMSDAEISVAQNLTREITEPGNLIKAIDKYMAKLMVNERTKQAAFNERRRTTGE